MQRGGKIGVRRGWHQLKRDKFTFNKRPSIFCVFFRIVHATLVISLLRLHIDDWFFKMSNKGSFICYVFLWNTHSTLVILSFTSLHSGDWFVKVSNKGLSIYYFILGITHTILNSIFHFIPYLYKKHHCAQERYSIL